MLVNLKYRSTEKEIMDDPSVEETDLKIALSDISRVNKMLGGNNITIRAVHKLIRATNPIKEEYTIIDLGCGDGEMLRAIAKSFRSKKENVKLIGVDLNEKSLSYAKKLSTSYPEITFSKLDLLEIERSELTCDIVICTLTLHHLKCEEIKRVMNKSIELATIGVVINDLHRSRVAYYLFKLFSLFFIRGHIAKNDGLISIKRGFKKQELKMYAEELRLKKYKIDWQWAFRYRWIVETTRA